MENEILIFDWLIRSLLKCMITSRSNNDKFDCTLFPHRNSVEDWLKCVSLEATWLQCKFSAGKPMFCNEIVGIKTVLST